RNEPHATGNDRMKHDRNHELAPDDVLQPGEEVIHPLLLVAAFLPTILVAQTARGPFARIAILRPIDGQSVDLEAGYIRHLEWHRKAKDTFGWYSYTVWATT